jgi:hypothetical protein
MKKLKHIKLFENFKIFESNYDIDQIIEYLDNWIESNSYNISYYSLEDYVKELLGLDKEITSSDETKNGVKIITIKYNDKDLIKICVSSDGVYNFGANSIEFKNISPDKLVKAPFGGDTRFYFDRDLLN